MAISLDGKISTRCYTPARFSTRADFIKLLELRGDADAILVGKKTLEADTMRLTVPREVLAGRRAPLRCVISKSGEWDEAHVLFKPCSIDEANHSEILLFTVGNTGREVKGVSTVEVGCIEEMLEYLVGKGVERLHCEGGGQLLKYLFEHDYVDELYLTWVGTKCFGGAGSPTISGEVGDYLPSTRHYQLIDFKVGNEGECFLKYAK